MEFNGIADRINVTHSSSLHINDSITIMAWAKDPPKKNNNSEGKIRRDLATWNSNTIDLGGGTLKTEFHIKWINYLAEDGTWKPINPEFIKTANGWVVKDAPFTAKAPLKSDETATFISNNRYDIFDKKEINSAPIIQTIKALGVESVEGEVETGNLGFGETTYIVYKNAYPSLNADLIYWVYQGKAPRLDKLVRFNTAPASDVRLDFEVEYETDKKTVIKEDKKELINGKPKKIKKEWKKKKLPDAYRALIINVVLKKSNLKALELEDEMGLPLHLPLPSIKEYYSF